MGSDENEPMTLKSRGIDIWSNGTIYEAPPVIGLTQGLTDEVSEVITMIVSSGHTAKEARELPQDYE